MSDPVWDYMTGQMHDTHPALLAAFQAESDAAVRDFAPELDIAYGTHARARFDLFRCPGTALATVIYFHAGYWQSRDKAMFRFLAPALLAAKLNMVLVNYPLCPDVAFAEVVATSVTAVPAAMRHVGPGRFILMGHSAGAHLVISALRAGLPSEIIGAVALSGVYDLVPLLRTPLNDRLGLTEDTARHHSVTSRLHPGGPPVLFAVGSLETAAFRQQNADMAGRWRDAGNTAHVLTVPGCNHFSLLRAVVDDQAGIKAFMLDLSKSSEPDAMTSAP
jgi:arylformamidase